MLLIIHNSIVLLLMARRSQRWNCLRNALTNYLYSSQKIRKTTNMNKLIPHQFFLSSLIPSHTIVKISFCAGSWFIIQWFSFAPLLLTELLHFLLGLSGLATMQFYFWIWSFYFSRYILKPHIISTEAIFKVFNFKSLVIILDLGAIKALLHILMWHWTILKMLSFHHDLFMANCLVLLQLQKCARVVS